MCCGCGQEPQHLRRHTWWEIHEIRKQRSTFDLGKQLTFGIYWNETTLKQPYLYGGISTTMIGHYQLWYLLGVEIISVKQSFWLQVLIHPKRTAGTEPQILENEEFPVWDSIMFWFQLWNFWGNTQQHQHIYLLYQMFQTVLDVHLFAVLNKNPPTFWTSIGNTHGMKMNQLSKIWTYGGFFSEAHSDNILSTWFLRCHMDDSWWCDI